VLLCLLIYLTRVNVAISLNHFFCHFKMSHEHFRNQFASSFIKYVFNLNYTRLLQIMILCCTCN
jgi:hypothetical protein